MTTESRPSGRAPDQLRAVCLSRKYTKHAEGSVLVECGDTKVLCTASVLEKVPPHVKGSGGGWLTAEYGMLPRATHTRGDREAARGKQSGRTQEIQRLIGRSLRAAVDLDKLGERTIHVDCDVLQADGGTRTASITGAWVAVHDAIEWLVKEGKLPASVIRDARRRLRQLENREVDAGPQGDLFAAAPEPVEAEPHPALDALRALDPDNLSPREALEKLYELKRLSE